MIRLYPIAVAACLILVATARADWLREIEVTSEPEADGRKLYTVRILPGETGDFDRIEFRCTFRQEFPWQDARGKRYTKIHEPVSFVYRHQNARLVDDLDAYFNFKVPVGLEQLKKTYGERVFNADHPVIVSRIEMSGYQDDEITWTITVDADGKYTVSDTPPAPKTEPAAPPGE